MNNLTILTLKILRKVYRTSFRRKEAKKLICDQNADSVSEKVYNLLISESPCMIARFGAHELSVVCNYLGVKQGSKSFLRYVQSKAPEWWWDENALSPLQANAGFFPLSITDVEKFSELMLQDAQEVNILGSWLANECYIESYLEAAEKVARFRLDPFWSKKPWTMALKGKKVLVIHPFSGSIEKQYNKRELLFSNPDILPNFELITVRAVQSLGGKNSEFSSWFDALDSMKRKMDNVDYDICLIGCGAYGFPLAAHAKRMGKKSVHVGGSLQLFFGIRGARWENEEPKNGTNYPGLINEYWIRPSEKERPSIYNQIEGGCYW